jgi:hypothetical protein
MYRYNTKAKIPLNSKHTYTMKDKNEKQVMPRGGH